MKLRLFCICLALVSSAVWAAKSEFTISIATMSNTLPPGEHVSESSSPASQTQRQLVFRLTSPTKPLPTAVAEVWMPEGLHLGQKAVLALVDENPVKQAELPVESLQMKVYWGPSLTVKPGQPKLLTWKDFPDSVKKAMKPDGQSSSGSMAVWTADPKKLQENAQLAGDYRLMSYAGSASISLDADQRFLAPLEVETEVDAKGTGAAEVSWKPVSGAVAYFVAVHAVTSDQTVIGWTSGESSDAPKQAGIDNCLNENQVSSLIAKNILLGPDKTRVTIPADIFKGADGTMIVVTAYGKDKEIAGKEVSLKAVVRSSATVYR